MPYYAGLPSSPRLVARTGTVPWKEHTGTEVYRKLKQLGVVTNHKLNTVWEDNVAPKVHACLDELGVRWTSTDIVRIGVVGKSSAPVVVWIGVKPGSLSGEDANTAALRCLNVLKEFDITDVDVEIRESSVIRSAGPMLHRPVFSSDPTAAVRKPLTHALGIPISAQATPHISGTGGFFMAEGGGSNKLLLITVRHVVFPPNKKRDKFERKDENQPRFNVLLLGDKEYENCLTSIIAKIERHVLIDDNARRRLKAVEGQDSEAANRTRNWAQEKIDEVGEAMNELFALHNDVGKNWATYASRVLGHVVCSPPIRFGAGTIEEGYTEDYAIIQVDDDKIDRTEFEGNVIDLGTKIPIWEFIEKMCPDVKDDASFDYPYDRLLKLWGIISDEEMRCPTILDQNDKPCLMVIKDGGTTGVTIGRASGIMSYVRVYFDDDSHQTSKEWPILPYDAKSGAFSAPGDSGAVIVDGRGRIGGLLTGGAGTGTDLDITYATPINFLLKSIRANGFPNAHPNPT